VSAYGRTAALTDPFVVSNLWARDGLLHPLHEQSDDFQSEFRFEPCFVFVFGKPVLGGWISRQATQHSMAA